MDRIAVSVVNRMLQDIDRRRAAAGVADIDTHVDSRAANPGIRSVTQTPGRAIRAGRLAAMTLLLIVICAATVIAWSEWRDRTPPEAPSPILAAALSPAAVKETSTAIEPIAEPVAPPVTVASESPPEAAPAITSRAEPESAQSTAAGPPIDKLKLSMRMSALVADTPAPRLPVKVAPPDPSAPVPVASRPGTTTFTNAPVRQVAADETVAAARALWNDGSRAAALVTLREALTAAEAARNSRATGTLARELARLEVADGRAQVALDLLKRLEPLFGEDADAWALRGNAEQRLAQHANAAESYLGALRLKPGEGKWMLGAAISLAALGKLEEARAWVEKARERDAVTPGIAAYLQQLGIGGRR